MNIFQQMAQDKANLLATVESFKKSNALVLQTMEEAHQSAMKDLREEQDKVIADLEQQIIDRFGEKSDADVVAVEAVAVASEPEDDLATPVSVG